MSDVVNDLRDHLAGAINLHPAVNVRAVAVYIIERAITEIERLRAQRATIRHKTIEDVIKELVDCGFPEDGRVCKGIRDLAQTDETKT
jgi:uncharacterized protein (UPF0335 family)